MTIVTFEELRDTLINRMTIESLIDNGRGVWGADFGSCSFAIRNMHISGYQASFKRLYTKQGSVSTNEEIERRYFTFDRLIKSPDSFNAIPTKTFAYWVSDSVIGVFKHHPPIGPIAKKGLSTGDNDQFLRCWHEIDFNKTTMAGGKKWIPVTKGGPFRRWYGNFDYVVNWENNGNDLRQFVDEKGKTRSVIRNGGFYFRSGITWNDITISSFSARYVPSGFIPMDAGPVVFTDDWEQTLCMLNSSVNWKLMSFLSPTCHFTVGMVASIPLIRSPINGSKATGKEAVAIAKADWDASETSWDFEGSALLSDCNDVQSVSDALSRWESSAMSRLARLKILEEENNRLFNEAYGLQNELSPEVPDEQITLYHPARLEDIKRLLSYAIGCMMGRYSLDTPALVYAHSGNVDFDPNQYKTFPADDDGIIPLLDADWGIREDTTNRIVEFIGVAWPKEYLVENLKFVADSLGPNNGEQPRETIRRYLATGFYKHHLSMYKKRPIYWLFSSGKQRAFQCLVYLHRYHEGTLARMRTEYVIPLQGQITARIEQLEGDKAKATSTSHRKKLQKAQDDLKKQQAELLTFEEKLKHAADQKISLDLDDGVKVNYGKFGDLLAESKAITGGKDEE